MDRGRPLNPKELEHEANIIMNENNESDDEIVNSNGEDSEDETYVYDEDDLSNSSSEDDETDEENMDDNIESDNDNTINNEGNDQQDEDFWQEITGDRNHFTFDVPITGPTPDVIGELRNKDPVHYYLYFINDDIINLLVRETNYYASQKIDVSRPATSTAKKPKVPLWIDTNPSEMKKFIGILIWMGLVRMPTLRDYWSRKDIYKNNISRLLSRNRFEQLLAMFHVARDGLAEPTDRLRKISAFTDALQAKFKSAYIPEESVCIDESNVPFRGRIVFRQYIPNKRHRYGIKVFKLCVGGGYTWAFKIYTGKSAVRNISVSHSVTCELMEGLLNHGRTLYVDNWYTSVTLATTMIQQNTHLVGTLRSRRKNNPKDVIQARLRRGEIIARQNQNKIIVLKWKDRRDVLMLSTKHDASTTTYQIRGRNVVKPAMIVDYNKGKTYIDLSDQMTAYSPYLRRTVKWWKRIVCHLITATTVTNALHLYNTINNKKMKVTEFREKIVDGLLHTKQQATNENEPSTSSVESLPLPGEPSTSSTVHCVPSTSTKNPSSSRIRHKLIELEGQKRMTRKRCSFCYKKYSSTQGAAYARQHTKRVNTVCDGCNTPFCIPCFQKEHKF